MLQPDAAQLVGQGEQKLVLVVMLRPEQLQRLVDEPLVRVDLRGRGGEVGGLVGDHVEPHVRAQLLRTIIAPGEHGRVEQRLVGGALVAIHAVLDARGQA